MFRRSSYASVAAGNSSQSQNIGPIRSGAFSHLANNTSSAGPQSTHSAHHSRHYSRSLDADGHHSSIAASWGRGGHLSAHSSQHGYLHGHGAGAQDGFIPSFFVPSYLRGSKHAQKLEEIHEARISALREHRSNHSSNGGSLSTSSSSANLHKAAPSHRGMTHDIVERAPPVFADNPVPMWPTRWNEADKFSQVELDDGGRSAKFAGSQKTHDEAASVRADHYMPQQCGIYYYEVTVVSKGKDGRMIGVGFSAPEVNLARIPGWEPYSYAYHGDDGQCFSNTTSGRPYGPKFGTLDVIGCGINFRTGNAFFTKNGLYLGVAFRDLKLDKKYYPIVGMKKPGETLRANFGQEAFSFDIDKMVQEEKEQIQAEIAAKKTSRRYEDDKGSADETQFIHRLVSQYLAHDGYVETARAFAKEVNDEERSLANDEDTVEFIEAAEDIDAVNRQRIRAAILEGDIDKALKFTMAQYPSVLDSHKNIYFKLRCRKFIEMVRRTNELSAQLHPVPTPASKRSTASNGHSYDYDFEMELDEQLGVHNGQGWNSNNNVDNDNMDTEDENDSQDAETRYQRLMDETIQYGMVLKKEFAGDSRKYVKRALEDTFALIAYENVGESALAPLLDRAGRVPVAEELNSAILVSLGKSSSAALERLTQQTEVLVEELAVDGGPGAFVNVRRDFLR